MVSMHVRDLREPGGFVLTAMNDQHVVARLDELADDRPTDESRAAKDDRSHQETLRANTARRVGAPLLTSPHPTPTRGARVGRTPAFHSATPIAT